jgi:hypothetical protein
LRGHQWCPNGHLDYGIGEGEGEVYALLLRCLNIPTYFNLSVELCVCVCVVVCVCVWECVCKWGRGRKSVCEWIEQSVKRKTTDFVLETSNMTQWNVNTTEVRVYLLSEEGGPEKKE